MLTHQPRRHKPRLLGKHEDFPLTLINSFVKNILIMDELFTANLFPPCDEWNRWLYLFHEETRPSDLPQQDLLSVQHRSAINYTFENCSSSAQQRRTRDGGPPQGQDKAQVDDGVAEAQIGPTPLLCRVDTRSYLLDITSPCSLAPPVTSRDYYYYSHNNERGRSWCYEKYSCVLHHTRSRRE
ncbi:hypothetical protein GW17_00030548 [Ensete ventricosum]|nr:hypothetical protein GW17_00030548 [Ensete ventricosum]